jgi:two-component system sensor histidine kinase QseC
MPKLWRSIRARLLVLLLSLLSLAMGLISQKIYSDSSHEVEELFDAQLAQTSRVLMGLVRHELSAESRRDLQTALDEALLLKNSNRDLDGLLGHHYESKLAFQMLDDNGELVFQSASAPKGLLSEMIAQLRANASLAWPNTWSAITP